LKGRKAVDTDPLDLDNTCGKKKKKLNQSKRRNKNQTKWIPKTLDATDINNTEKT
jgi:hypothetical protein